MVDLLVGTGEGLYALAEGGGWSVEGHYLEDIEISQIARDKAGGGVLVATRGGGLLRLDPRTGASHRLGEDALPEKVRCVAVSPADGDSIYVGTEPVGIFMSEDGGASWTECAEVARMGERLKWGYPVPSVPPACCPIRSGCSPPWRRGVSEISR